ncbi:MAG TPA: 2-C-methyl-D-erythritol 4-phosphate cytidylyltransferase [Tepidisphaeraceae bacterium]|jgi:2-C-methyl-D-erythritol 4-phosphate cytidylyltransferase
MAADPTFSALILTAAPTGLAAESGGAFVKIDGREAILRSVELFLNRENVKQVLVVFTAEDTEEGRRKYGGHLGLFGVKVLTGGPKWIDQLAAGAEKVSPEVSHVIVHDAARPAVPYTDIEALMEAAGKNPIVTLATPLRAPIVEVDEGGNALAFHPPTQYMQLLTPQSFSLASFKELAGGKKEPHPSKFTVLKGSPLNVRVGGPGDERMVKTMLGMLPRPKVKGPSNPFEEAQW